MNPGEVFKKMSENIRFKIAEGNRIKITKQQRKQIKDMYYEISKKARIKAEELSHLENISSVVRKKYLEDLVKELNENITILNQTLEKSIQENMKAVSLSVVNDNEQWLKKVGINLSASYKYVPNDVVATLVSGKLYKGNWTFSKAIWKDAKAISNELQSIVANGIAAQKPTYEIAKDLERYVNPRARKSWEWSKVYPNTRKKIDYNAQRLARTLISHAFQESFVRVTKNNPFFESYKWLISNSDRVCPICQDRATLNQYGLGPGIFPKNALPMDHPNGMCTWIVIQQKSYDEISNDLSNWAKGQGDKKLNNRIDNYVNDAFGNSLSFVLKYSLKS